MSIFARTFPIDDIKGDVLDQNPWFTDMLGLWRPAGGALHRDMTETRKLAPIDDMPDEDPERLRLAIRNRYLNFYRGGQSIARIDFVKNEGLRAHIHNKFVRGDEGRGQTYFTLTSAGIYDPETGRLREYGGLTELSDWVANANKYVGDEKRFVDAVVARNPNTVDFEMALPAYSSVPKVRTAPRMDLVALEPFDDRWRIVFWEVKLADDPRARCEGPAVPARQFHDQNAAPKVLAQLYSYNQWLSDDDRCDSVKTAYQNACRLLVEFHKFAKSVNPHIGKLGKGIVAAAAEGAPPLCLDDDPRLLIGDLPGEDGNRNASFVENGHLDKLRNEGLRVQMVQSMDQMMLEARH